MFVFKTHRMYVKVTRVLPKLLARDIALYAIDLSRAIKKIISFRFVQGSETPVFFARDSHVINSTIAFAGKLLRTVIVADERKVFVFQHTLHMCKAMQWVLEKVLLKLRDIALYAFDMSHRAIKKLFPIHSIIGKSQTYLQETLTQFVRRKK